MTTSLAQRGCSSFARWVQKPVLASVPHLPTLRRIFAVQAEVMHRPFPHTLARRCAVAPRGAGRVMLRWGVRRDRRLLYLDGGGFVLGGAGTHRWRAARRAAKARAGAVMVAVIPGYRLAPEAPFPAAQGDGRAAHGALLQEEPAQAIAGAGESAGAGLALSLLAKARGAGVRPPAALGLVSPLGDMTFRGPSARRLRQSDGLFPAAFGRRAVRAYLTGADPADRRVSPLGADLSDAPPTLVQAARAEVLTDGARRLAERLPEAQLDLWDRVYHVWQLAAGWRPEADRALARRGAFLDWRLDWRLDR